MKLITDSSLIHKRDNRELFFIKLKLENFLAQVPFLTQTACLKIINEHAAAQLVIVITRAKKV